MRKFTRLLGILALGWFLAKAPAVAADGSAPQVPSAGIKAAQPLSVDHIIEQLKQEQVKLVSYKWELTQLEQAKTSLELKLRSSKSGMTGKGGAGLLQTTSAMSRINAQIAQKQEFISESSRRTQDLEKRLQPKPQAQEQWQPLNRPSAVLKIPPEPWQPLHRPSAVIQFPQPKPKAEAVKPLLPKPQAQEQWQPLNRPSAILKIPKPAAPVVPALPPVQQQKSPPPRGFNLDHRPDSEPPTAAAPVVALEGHPQAEPLGKDSNADRQNSLVSLAKLWNTLKPLLPWAAAFGGIALTFFAALYSYLGKRRSKDVFTPKAEKKLAILQQQLLESEKARQEKEALRLKRQIESEIEALKSDLFAAAGRPEKIAELLKALDASKLEREETVLLERVGSWLNPQQRAITRLALRYRQADYRGTLVLSPTSINVPIGVIPDLTIQGGLVGISMKTAGDSAVLPDVYQAPIDAYFGSLSLGPYNVSASVQIAPLLLLNTPGALDFMFLFADMVDPLHEGLQLVLDNMAPLPIQVTSLVSAPDTAAFSVAMSGVAASVTSAHQGALEGLLRTSMAPLPLSPTAFITVPGREAFVSAMGGVPEMVRQGHSATLQDLMVQTYSPLPLSPAAFIAMPDTWSWLFFFADSIPGPFQTAMTTVVNNLPQTVVNLANLLSFDASGLMKLISSTVNQALNDRHL